MWRIDREGLDGLGVARGEPVAATPAPPRRATTERGVVASVILYPARPPASSPPPVPGATPQRSTPVTLDPPATELAPLARRAPSRPRWWWGAAAAAVVVAAVTAALPDRLPLVVALPAVPRERPPKPTLQGAVRPAATVPPAPAPPAPAPAAPESMTYPGRFPLGSVSPVEVPHDEAAGLAAWLVAHCDRILLVGHTCSVGPEAVNRVIGEERARRVRRRLVELGIPYRKITITSAGSLRPLADNRTAEGRERNRRVTMSCVPSNSRGEP